MKTKKGFTLIELLVVVLIIGILAAIAVPQYQLAVGKSRFATIKSLTRSLANAAEAYHLANGHYPNSLSLLDISVPAEANCGIWWTENSQNAVACLLIINNKTIRYYHFLKYDFLGRGGQSACYAFSSDQTDIINKICQQETGKQGSCSNSDDYCQYSY